MSTINKKIYYHDTDAGGVVYYANYLKFLEEARTQFFEDLGLGVRAFGDRGFIYAVRYCNIAYKSPARYGNTLMCDARVVKVTGAQIIFAQRVWNGEDQRTFAEAEVALVCLDKNFKPCSLPEDLRSKLEVA
jgi:tol-pal system-associated acyl-CoA thioesterase